MYILFGPILCPYVIYKSLSFYTKKKKSWISPSDSAWYKIEDLILAPEQFLEQNISLQIFPLF